MIPREMSDKVYGKEAARLQAARSSFRASRRVVSLLCIYGRSWRLAVCRDIDGTAGTMRLRGDMGMAEVQVLVMGHLWICDGGSRVP